MPDGPSLIRRQHTGQEPDMTNHRASFLQRQRELRTALLSLLRLAEGLSWPCTRYSKTGRKAPSLPAAPGGVSGHGPARAGTRRRI
jgi:hypothetical protein